jgi:hypothetical protein
MEPEHKLGPDGMLLIGDKGVIHSGFTGKPRLVPESRMAGFTPPPPKVLRTIGHYKEWIEACKGGAAANCHFGFGSLLVETAVLGTIAQRTEKVLVWSAEEGRIANDAEANQYVNPPYRSGWTL